VTGNRVLVLRALGLGDLLTAVPALRALRRALPDADLVLACPDGLAPLVALVGIDARVHDTVGLEQPLGVRADLAVNLHGRGPQSHRLLRPVADRQVAFGNAEAGVPGPVWRPDEHERERWCRLVAEVLDVVADPLDVRLAPPAVASPAPGAVVVHPGAKSASRRWPAERWRAVVERLHTQGHDVVVTGSAAERQLADRVAGRRGRVLAGATDLAGLAALVAGARAVVCGDTGIGHLAAAYGVPSVHLFGPSRPADWGPPPGPHRVLWHGSARGDPLGEHVDPALLRISVAEVTDQLDRLPARGGTPSGAGLGEGPTHAVGADGYAADRSLDRPGTVLGQVRRRSKPRGAAGRRLADEREPDERDAARRSRS
jgi:ADP-heptose:LPS heptosyltransferase